MIDKSKSKNKIEQWGTVGGGSPFDAPEIAGIHVVGIVPVDDNEEEMTSIKTSRVVDADGCFVLTRSGSVYELGEPSPDFLAALAKMGRTFNPEHPITVRRG